MDNPASETVTVDVLVVGAGVGGLSAAMSAGLGGLNVLVAEKTGCFGGTGARSGGLLWVPLNHISVSDGIADSIGEARAYVSAEAGDMFNPVVVDSYLANAPLMAETYTKHFELMQFVRNDVGGDNHPRQPGAKDKGRSLSVPPLDGRTLGAWRKKLAPPLETMTFLGMMVPSRDILHFFNIWRSGASFKVVKNLLFTYVKDLITCGQTMQLANGAALVSRMAKSAVDLGVPFWFNAPARELLTENGRVVGAVVIRDGQPVTVRTIRGVVLATGGYPHDQARRTKLAPIEQLSKQMHSAANPAAQGDGLRMAEAVGGQVENRLFNTLSWWPISRVPRSNGSSAVFPHMVDRSKPGFIMVARSGRRFERETAIGNDIVRAMAAAAGDGPVEAWLIGDHKAVRRFGIGIARPAPIPIGRHLRSGYVLQGRTLSELASKAGIDAEGLEKQVSNFNDHAARGEDPEFHRGESALEKRAGDPDNKPNPSLRPLDTPPFFAVKILPGDFSTLAGLRTDGCARVLNDAGQPVIGLYAAGNDLSTMGGGHSPAGGFTIGAAVTFGFVAGQHLSGKLHE